jgi:AraC-like DNA-binding protein
MSKTNNVLSQPMQLKAAAQPPQSADEIRSRRLLISNQNLARRLAGSSLFREFQRAFEAATALPLTLRAVESWQLAHVKSRNQNAFCAWMIQANHSCAACLRLQQKVCAGANGVASTASCQFGLNETAVAVKIGSEIVAYLQTGQVFFKAPTAKQTERALNQIREWGLDPGKDEAIRLYQVTPVVRRKEYEARVKLLQFFADQLGALANQTMLLQTDLEPMQITHARELIEAHYQDDVSLIMISRQVGMGVYYFCKQFKKATGLNYTRYVSRLRIEKAKNLLLNLNYRISEIAYEVGFKSLTHFNRIFKRVAGESPTEYRQHLQTA